MADNRTAVSTIIGRVQLLDGSFGELSESDIIVIPVGDRNNESVAEEDHPGTKIYFQSVRTQALELRMRFPSRHWRFIPKKQRNEAVDNVVHELNRRHRFVQPVLSPSDNCHKELTIQETKQRVQQAITNCLKVSTLRLVQPILETRQVSGKKRLNGPQGQQFHPSNLLRAAMEGDLGAVEECLRAPGSTVECKTIHQETALHLACQNGHTDVARYLVETRGANIECRTIHQETPLHLACLYDRMEVVQYLLEDRGANVECRNYSGLTPLQLAKRERNIEIANYLDPAEHRQDLLAAAKSGDLSVVEKCCLELFVHAECHNQFGWTPLHLASRNGHMDVVRFLVEKRNADIECRTAHQDTPLHLACRSGHVDVIQYLVQEKGANVKLHNDKGWTPLQVARKAGKLGVAHLLDPARHHRELLDAAERGDLDAVKKCCSAPNCDTDCQDKDHCTPLHLACQRGHVDVIRFLVAKQKTKIERKDFLGCTPLHLACRSGHLAAVQYLAREGNATIECRNDRGSTPLHLSCSEGRADVARYLIEELGAEVDCEDIVETTPLHWACRMGHEEVVRYLVEAQGANIERQSKHQETPLHVACLNGHIDVVRYLVQERGASTNTKNSNKLTALQVAEKAGKTEVVEFLLKPEEVIGAAKMGDLSLLQKSCSTQRGDVECQDIDEWTPLHWACRNGHMDVVKFLVESRYAKILCRTNLGWTPLHLACRNGRMDVLLYLAEKLGDAEIDVQTNSKESPLHLACRNGHVKAVHYLVGERHAKMERQDTAGWTPLHWACRNGHAEIVEYLVSSRGANLECRNHLGYMPLHLAALFGHMDIVRFLVESRGADFECRSKEGSTPLQLSERAGKIDVANYLKLANKRRRYLLAASKRGDLSAVMVCFQMPGLSAEYRDVDGWTALHWACRNGHMGIARYLAEEQSASVECRTNQNWTPLHLSCRNGFLHVARYLVEHQGAQINCETGDSETPYQLAESAGKAEVARYLRLAMDQQNLGIATSGSVTLLDIRSISRAEPVSTSRARQRGSILINQAQGLDTSTVYTTAVLNGVDSDVGELQTPGVSDPTLVWTADIGGTPYVFVSHRGCDTKEEIARPTSWFLSAVLGIGTFFDGLEGSMSPGRRKSLCLAEAAHRCTHAFLILSPRFRESKYCVRELNTLLARWRRNSVQLYPALWGVENVDEYAPQLNDLVWIEARPPTECPGEFMVANVWPFLLRTFLQDDDSRRGWGRDLLEVLMGQYVETHPGFAHDSLKEFVEETARARATTS